METNNNKKVSPYEFQKFPNKLVWRREILKQTPLVILQHFAGGDVALFLLLFERSKTWVFRQLLVLQMILLKENLNQLGKQFNY